MCPVPLSSWRGGPKAHAERAIFGVAELRRDDRRERDIEINDAQVRLVVEGHDARFRQGWRCHRYRSIGRWRQEIRSALPLLTSPTLIKLILPGWFRAVYEFQ